MSHIALVVSVPSGVGSKHLLLWISMDLVHRHGYGAWPLREIVSYEASMNIASCTAIALQSIGASFSVPPNNRPLRSLPTHIISLPYYQKHLPMTKKSTLVAIAMDTRSGAPLIDPAVASKATKATPARKTNRAKSKRLSRPKPNKASPRTGFRSLLPVATLVDACESMRPLGTIPLTPPAPILYLQHPTFPPCGS